GVRSSRSGACATAYLPGGLYPNRRCGAPATTPNAVRRQTKTRSLASRVFEGLGRAEPWIKCWEVGRRSDGPSSVLEAKHVARDRDRLVAAAGIGDLERDRGSGFATNRVGPAGQRFGGPATHRDRMGAGEQLAFRRSTGQDATHDDAVVLGFDDHADAAIRIGALDLQLLICIAIVRGHPLDDGGRGRDGTGENDRAQHDMTCCSPTKKL